MPPLVSSNQSAQIAAASSLQFVLPEIVTAFKQQTGHNLRVTYGSSGNFLRQIVQGAPFELFLSADESYATMLVEKKLTVDSGRVYALGRLAVITPENSGIALTPDLSSFATALEEGHLQHFAIANPDHAPYGRAARETLQALGLWQALQPRLVKGENVAQATQFAISGSSQGGIVAYALALAPAISRLSRVLPIDQSRHQPIRQRMVLLKSAGGIARLFYDFLSEPEAQAIFQRRGFEVPQV